MLYLRVRLKYFYEWLKTIWRYYRKPYFACTDLLLRTHYLIINPFQVSKRFLKKNGEMDIHTFGETPLTTLQSISNWAGVTRNDRVYDLGCATGRTSFWLRQFVGCHVVGVECVPTFHKRAERMRKIVRDDGLQFLHEDMRKVDFRSATFVYLYGTCFDDEFLKELIDSLRVAERGTKIITVSYALQDYVKDPLFKLIKESAFPFTWGTAEVYLQERL